MLNLVRAYKLNVVNLVRLIFNFTHRCLKSDYSKKEITLAFSD